MEREGWTVLDRLSEVAENEMHVELERDLDEISFFNEIDELRVVDEIEDLYRLIGRL